MAYFDPARRAAPDTVLGHLSRTLRSLAAELITWNETRLARRTLGALSDRELDDIGLHRGDVDALGLPRS